MYEIDEFDDPLKDHQPYNDFVSNEKLISKNWYKSINGFLIPDSRIEFLSAKMEEIQNYQTKFIILCLFFCFSFYLSLVTAILTYDLVPIVFSAIIYLIASFFQIIIIPEPQSYNSKIQFNENIEKILNLTVKVNFSTKDGKNVIEYPIKYITDITGTINIPKEIKYVKIETMHMYFDKDFFKFKESYIYMNGSYDLNIRLFYNDQEIHDSIFYTTYNLYSNWRTHSINFFKRIICLLLMQWIFALCGKFRPKKCVIISPAKLISTKKNISDTHIYIHGKKIEFENFICLNIQSEKADKLKKLYNKKMKELEEKRQIKEENKRKIKRQKEKEWEEWEKEREKRRQELQENTKILSCWPDNKNYKITVKKIYNSVKVYLEIYYRDETKYETIDVGEYDQYAEEYEEDYDNCNIYYPKGKDIKIQVTNYASKYIIKVGNKFTESYFYKSET